MKGLICLDTNSWFSERVLRSSVGAALIYAMGNSGDRIFLPEVVERELVSLTIRTCRSLLEDIAEARRTIQTLTGRHAGHDGPIEEGHIREALSDRFLELEGVLVRKATSDEACRRAFDRILDCKAPNTEKNQQAKDSLLWETLLSLPAGTQVLFVTSDKAFYENQSLKSSFPADLLKDTQERSIDISIFNSCGDLLASLAPQAPDIDQEAVTSLLKKKVPFIISEAMQELRRESAKVCVKDEVVRLSLYLTSNGNEVAVVFKINASVAEDDGSDFEAIRIEGRCMYLRDVNSLTEPSLTSISGETHGIHRMQFSMSGGFLGHSFKGEQSPELRVPLDLIEAGLLRIAKRT